MAIKSWNGIEISTMTREELIKALNEIADILIQTRLRLQELRGTNG